MVSRFALTWGLGKGLEPDEAKVSRPVLRGAGGGNTTRLPDRWTSEFSKQNKHAFERVVIRL